MLISLKAVDLIATILKKQEKIIEEYESNCVENGSKRTQTIKRIKLPTYHNIDVATEEWFKQTMAHNNVVIGGPEIKAQALKYNIYLNQPDFQASNGWLQRFRERNHISFIKIVGEGGLVKRSALKQVDSLENELKVKTVLSNIDSFFF